MSEPARIQSESPDVIALRKAIRGEPLTEDERSLLASATSKPSGPGTPHAEVMSELRERERRGE